MTTVPQTLAVLCALAVAAASTGAAAEPACPGEPLPPRQWPEGLDRENSEVTIDADNADLSRDSISVVSGEVVLERADQSLEADQVTVFHDRDQVAAEGNVAYRDRDLDLEAEDAVMDLAADTAELRAVRYRLARGAGRGEATMARIEGDSSSWLSSVTFTTCPEGNDDWQLTAREMRLDHERGEGRARGLGLRFKNVPLFYLPWASFPLDDRRKSGFLVPSLGRSDDDGIDLAVPYYWNIAPHMDATLTPRFIGDRGTLLGTEFRYLGEANRGLFDVQYMADDDRTGRHRGYSTWRHLGVIRDDLMADIDIRHVSDAQFFEDFGNSLQATSISFLRSRIDLRAGGEGWHGGVLLDAYQTVDREIRPEREPYDRLPRLYFDGDRQLGESNLRLRFGAELAAFERDLGVEGRRLDLYPRLEWSHDRPAGHLRPSLGLRHTRYDLDRSGDDSPSRTTAIASLEGGLVFERSLGEGRVQTLEPRFHYLYVPFEDQRNLPEFDSAELTFGFNQLFRSNRFTGADRQGDANQLSLALTTRILDSRRGRQVLEASVGTIAYFRDLNVQLGDGPATSPATSPLVTELAWQPLDRWRVALGFQWDPDDEEFDQGLADLQYRGDDGQIFNAAYRRRTDLVEQVDLSFHWPLNERWSLVGRYNYSLRDDTDLETLLGFEYESCCWALRAMGRRFIRTQDGSTRDGIYLELELKGLGSLGRGTAGLLERAILGYRVSDYRYQY